MDPNYEKIDGSEVKMKLTPSKKFENFWYHYKWHSIVALFLVIVLCVLIAQSCTKTEADAFVLYAGNHTISRSSANGSSSEYETARSSLKKIAADYTDDGVVNISFLDLFVVNAEETEKILSENPGYEINSALVKEDTDSLEQKILFGEYYLCFLSERLFREYEEAFEEKIFCDLSSYAPEGSDHEYASPRGVYLRSLAFYELPEISNLPDDTVVCLRQLSDVSKLFGRKNNEDYFHRGEDMMKKLLSYGITAK